MTAADSKDAEQSANVLDGTKPTLSASEAKLYDRQLRLWGVEAQQKLRSTNVLIAGLNSLGAEVCKNVVLTGVNSVTLLDHRPLAANEMPGQFMVDEADCKNVVGQNRAFASVNRVSTLNPNVKVSASDRNLNTIEDAFFDQFNIVCVIDYPFEVVNKIDEVCRSKGVCFLACDCFGSFGFMFSDCGRNFECRSEQIKINKDKTEVKQVENHVISFKSFKECFPCESSTTSANEGSNSFCLNKMAKSNPVFTLALLKDSLLSKNLDLSNLSFETSIDELSQIGVKYEIDRDELPFKLLSDANFGSPSLTEVAAVVGGVVGQEIIKLASRNDVAFNNFFSYNAINSDARVIAL